MPDDFEIPDIPDVDGGGGSGGQGGGTGAGGGRRRRWPWLAAGLVIGVVLGLVGPDLIAPHLPDSLRSDRLRIGGEVLKKRTDAERLLLTVETDSGAMLATFRRRISAIDLLVEPGDSITLVLERYRPFVEDPGLQGVRKGRRPAGGAPAPAAEGEPDRATDAGTDTLRPAPSEGDGAGPDGADTLGGAATDTARTPPADTLVSAGAGATQGGPQGSGPPS